MPLQKILLRIIALSIFAIFIAAFISYYSKPADNKKVLALNFANDTTGKVRVDSFDTVRVYLPSSKSIILRRDKPAGIPLLKSRKDSQWHIRTNTPSSLKKDTAKTSPQPKQ